MQLPFQPFFVGWGLHAECSFHFVPKALFTVCVISVMKADPWVTLYSRGKAVPRNNVLKKDFCHF